MPDEWIDFEPSKLTHVTLNSSKWRGVVYIGSAMYDGIPVTEAMCDSIEWHHDYILEKYRDTIQEVE